MISKIKTFSGSILIKIEILNKKKFIWDAENGFFIFQKNMEKIPKKKKNGYLGQNIFYFFFFFFQLKILFKTNVVLNFSSS